MWVFLRNPTLSQCDEFKSKKNRIQQGVRSKIVSWDLTKGLGSLTKPIILERRVQ